MPDPSPLARAIDQVEEAYEFMLAYAAQGVREESRGGQGIRAFLLQLADALESLAGLAAAEAGRLSPPQAEAGAGFVAVLERDVEPALAAVRLALAAPSIGSAIVDNLNASLHLRTVLTDLFLIESALAEISSARIGPVGTNQ
jgi:hypothetical protein